MLFLTPSPTPTSLVGPVSFQVYCLNRRANEKLRRKVLTDYYQIGDDTQQHGILTSALTHGRHAINQSLNGTAVILAQLTLNPQLQ